MLRTEQTLEFGLVAGIARIGAASQDLQMPRLTIPGSGVVAPQ